MTDKEKLDAIRAEIHRLVDIRGYDREMANDLFAFMDSLPNEPVSEDLGKVGSLKSLEYYPEKKTANKTSKGVFDANMPRRKAYLRGFKDGAHAHKELIANKPVSEELEEASKEWLRPQLDKSYANYGEAKMMELTHFDGYAMLDAIEFGANWQKEKDESITEDLEEYINELSKQFPEVSFAKLSMIAVRVAKWKEQQMITKAVDGVITFDYYGNDNKTYGCIAHDSFCLEDIGLKDTDKVKMIIVKDEMS